MTTSDNRIRLSPSCELEHNFFHFLKTQHAITSVALVRVLKQFYLPEYLSLHPDQIESREVEHIVLSAYYDLKARTEFISNLFPGLIQDPALAISSIKVNHTPGRAAEFSLTPTTPSAENGADSTTHSLEEESFPSPSSQSRDTSTDDFFDPDSIQFSTDEASQYLGQDMT